jgi:hypothetical protein
MGCAVSATGYVLSAIGFSKPVIQNPKYMQRVDKLNSMSANMLERFDTSVKREYNKYMQCHNEMAVLARVVNARPFRKPTMPEKQRMQHLQIQRVRAAQNMHYFLVKNQQVQDGISSVDRATSVLEFDEFDAEVLGLLKFAKINDDYREKKEKRREQLRERNEIVNEAVSESLADLKEDAMGRQGMSGEMQQGISQLAEDDEAQISDEDMTRLFDPEAYGEMIELPQFPSAAAHEPLPEFPAVPSHDFGNHGQDPSGAAAPLLKYKQTQIRSKPSVLSTADALAQIATELPHEEDSDMISYP